MAVMTVSLMPVRWPTSATVRPARHRACARVSPMLTPRLPALLPCARPPSSANGHAPYTAPSRITEPSLVQDIEPRAHSNILATQRQPWLVIDRRRLPCGHRELAVAPVQPVSRAFQISSLGHWWAQAAETSG